MTSHTTDLDVRISGTEDTVDVHVLDRRGDALAVFGDLTPELQRQLASDAWAIGLRALGNARAQAREARLTEIGDRLVADLDDKLARQLDEHQRGLAASLAKFFDPSDGSLCRRITELVADEGALARQLGKYVGPEHSVLVEALRGLVGEASPLLRRLAESGDESVVKAIEDRFAAALDASQRELARALDPTTEDSPIRRFLVSLRDDMAKADRDRSKQQAAALAAIDANDEGSLISRLLRETQQARESVLAAINPDAPDSPMAAIRTSIEGMLARQSARQEKLAIEMREAVARIETRRADDAKSPRGGLTFEDAVAEFVAEAVADGPYIAETTGAATGSVARCKKGDVVVRFTGDSAFAGAAVVFEAKRDSSYTIRRALEELDAARKNREACAGVFVMAASHAPAGFPRFARHGNNVLVQWDEADPAAMVNLRAALYVGMALVSQPRTASDPEGASAVNDLVLRLETEITRIEKMEKLAESARRSNDGMLDELRKARRATEVMVRDATSALRALHVEVTDESTLARTPITFSATAGTSPAPS
jgi:hypothetical protein